MKIKYKNIDVLIFYTKIQKSILKNKFQNNSIVLYKPPLNNIVVYTFEYLSSHKNIKNVKSSSLFYAALIADFPPE